MPAASGRRYLTTVLFVDIVGSTAVATDLGDLRWRNLLTRFRRAARLELRRFGGRERNSTGDGFLAAFPEPARAIRAAAAIAIAAQEIGLDVRAGVHTGECEEIDGELGGVAVHIASRVIGLAGPAEILTTQTVRDVVAGSGIGFADRGSQELKGIEGEWRAFAVETIDGAETPMPLTRDDAMRRLRASTAQPRRRFGRGRIAIAAVAAAIAAAAIAAALVDRGGSSAAPVVTPAPVSLVRLDLRSKKLTVLRDAVHGIAQSYGLFAVAGTLWQIIPGPSQTLVERRMSTGAIEKTLPLPITTVNVAFGYGSIWVLENAPSLSGPQAGASGARIQRIDEVSGRTLATIHVKGDVSAGTVAVGNGAVWVLETNGTLVRVDPVTGRPTGRYATGAVETSTLIPLAGYDWICECSVNKVLRFDPGTHKSTIFKIAEQAYLVGVQTSKGTQTLWLLDPSGGTLTAMNPRTGQTGQPIGLGGDPQDAVIANGAVWASAGRIVDRVALPSHDRTTIALPPGVYVATIAADAATHSLWLGTSTH